MSLQESSPTSVQDSHMEQGGKRKLEEPLLGKRERKSRLIMVDGHAVLRANNYSAEIGGSVFDEIDDSAEASMEDETFHLEIGESGTYSRDKHTNKVYFITSAGRVMNVEEERARIRNPRQVLEKPERKVDPVAQAHALKLRQSKEAAEKSRLSFVAQHLDLFKPFLSSGLVSKAEAARSSRNLVPQHKQYSQQPACIDKKAIVMRPYQIEGINFMMKMHHNGMGCVLADEMGLGMFVCVVTFPPPLPLPLN